MLTVVSRYGRGVVASLLCGHVDHDLAVQMLGARLERKASQLGTKKSHRTQSTYVICKSTAIDAANDTPSETETEVALCTRRSKYRMNG
jgi:hypothetical protein